MRSFPKTLTLVPLGAKGKKQKLRSEDQLEELREMLGANRPQLTDHDFSSAGGSLFRRMAQGGEVALLCAKDLERKDSNRRIVIEMSDKKDKDGAKKKKMYQIDAAQASLVGKFRDMRDQMHAKLEAIKVKYVESDEIAKGCEDCIIGLSRWRSIANNRYDFFLAMVNNFLVGVCVDYTPLEGEDEDEELVAIKDQLLQTSIVAQGADLDSEKTSNLARCFASDAVINMRTFPVLLKHTWTGTQFADVPLWATLIQDLKLVQQVRNAELQLARVVKNKAIDKQPAPIEAILELAPCLELDYFCIQVEAATSEDDIKTLEKSFASAVKRMADVADSVKQASKQMLDVVEKAKTRESKEKEEAAKKLAKEREALSKKEEKSKKDKSQSTASGKSDNLVSTCRLFSPSIALSACHAKLQPIHEFKDYNELVAYKSNHRLEDLGPYIIKEAQAVAEILAERGPKSSMAVFQIQFGNTVQVKDERRGQQPFTHDRRDVLRETILGCAPVPKDIPGCLPMVKRAIHSVSQFGMLPTACSNGIFEYQCTANIRFQVRGQREVFIMQTADVVAFVDSLDQNDRRLLRGNLVDGLMHFFQTMDAGTFAQLLDSVGGRSIVRRSILGPGSLSYIPFGYVICERTVGTQPVIGIRVATLDNANVEAFITQVKALGKYGFDVDKKQMNALLAFWKDIGSTFDTFSDTVKGIVNSQAEPKIAADNSGVALAVSANAT